MRAEKYKIENISIVSGDVILADIAKSDGGPVFDFQPGQYAMLMIFDRDGKLMEEHPFSIASSPSQKRALQFGIKIIGKFTRRLAELKRGDNVYILGPFGNFIFDPEKHKDAVFIAGGVGITPFMSSFRYAFDNNLQNKLTLLYSARTIESALYFKEIKQLEDQNKNFKAYFAVTDEDVPADILRAKKCFIDLKMIQEAVDGSVSGKEFFICGPPGFMGAMINCLKGMGVGEDRIFTEKFSMVPSLGQSLGDKWFKYVFRGASAVFLAVLVMIFLNEKEKLAVKEELDRQKEVFLEETVRLLEQQLEEAVRLLEQQSITTAPPKEPVRQLQPQQPITPQQPAQQPAAPQQQPTTPQQSIVEQPIVPQQPAAQQPIAPQQPIQQPITPQQPVEQPKPAPTKIIIPRTTIS